ncbi:MAG TPA: PIG-L family deacetylase [Verrucomicrobiae bacterium]
MPKAKSSSAIGIAAHPDDIEFYMAGTLLLLKRAGFDIHYLTLASGSCGSLKSNAAQTRRIRRRESQNAAALLEAQFHSSLVDDLEIVYDLKLLRRLAAIIRNVRPRIVLTHSPQDYMEDHTNTSRLAVTAAFARGMPNFRTTPMREAIEGDVTVYHAMPHGLRDPLRKKITPELFVNTSAVHHLKGQALAAHKSQQGWLDASQGLNSYLKTMDDLSLAVGGMSGRFTHAEGWRRHLHLGFSAHDEDPLREILGNDCLLNKKYEQMLERD